MNAPIGVLRLDSTEPNIVGDTSSVSTYAPRPARIVPVTGCTVERLIFKPDASLAGAVVGAARDLEQDRVCAITSGCGFFVRYQRLVASSVDVPVLLSSLLLLPLITATVSGRVGVITASARHLTPDVLELAGVERDRIAIQGMDDSPAFWHSYMAQRPGRIDYSLIEQETVAAAASLLRRHPDVRALLIECSLLPTHASAVQLATRCPTFDFLSLIDLWLAAIDITAPTRTRRSHSQESD